MTKLDTLRAERERLATRVGEIDKLIEEEKLQEARERYWRELFVKSVDVRLRLGYAWGRLNPGVTVHVDVEHEEPTQTTLLAPPLPETWARWQREDQTRADGRMTTLTYRLSLLDSPTTTLKTVQQATELTREYGRRLNGCYESLALLERSLKSALESVKLVRQELA